MNYQFDEDKHDNDQERGAYPLLDKIHNPVSINSEKNVIDLQEDVENHSISQNPYPVQYSAIGVPNIQESAFDPSKYQKKVKCMSKILKIAGFISVVSGFINIFANAIFLVFMGRFSTFYFTDIDGQNMEIHLGKSGLFIFALIKIIFGLLLLKQGKASLKVVQPILKEYKDAEQGITQGIQMNERRSKQMTGLIKITKNLIIATLIIGTLSYIYACFWFDEQAIKFVEQKYWYIVSHQNQSIQQNYAPSKIQNTSSNLTFSNSTIHPTLQQFNVTNSSSSNFSIIIPESQISQDNISNNYQFETNVLIKRSKKYSKDKYEQFLERLPYMTKEKRQNFALKYTVIIVTACFIYQAAIYLFIQGLFICLIKKLRTNQEILENKYMGPEIIQQVLPRTQVHSESPEIQPVIQYLPVSQNNQTGKIIAQNQIV